MKGALTINHADNDDDTFFIEIEDRISGTRFLEVQVPTKNLMLALARLSLVDCEFELHAKYVGMRYENKEEIVTFVDYRPGDYEVNLVLGDYEVDGWRARREDIGNHHRLVSSKRGEYSYRVVFTRYVNPETGEPVE